MQKIQFSIPEPCHQNWDTMTPTQQGRFCNACAKQVVDFSAMSDTQVLNYFSSIKNEKVCGRAYPDQLERAITLPKYPTKKLFWYWNYITMLFLFFSKTNTAKAQGGIKVVTQLQPNKTKPVDINSALQGRVGGMVINNNNIVKGKITDEAGNPIACASVIIKGTKNGVATDANGFYKIRTNINSDIVVMTAIGFERKEIRLQAINTFDTVLTKMETQLMGDVVIVGGMINTDENYSEAVNPRHIAVLEVKDNATLLPIKRATVIIDKVGFNTPNSVLTDEKGIYKLKKIKEEETYTVTIIADGYIDEAIEIKGRDFDERKIVKPIFLQRTPSLADYKKLDPVVISTTQCTIRKTYTTGFVTVKGQMLSRISAKRTFTDSIKLITTKISGSLKVYPNPVQKGNSINLSLQLKQTGIHSIQIIDAAGQIILQKQTSATAKQYIENIQTSSSWSSGTYFVRIFDNKNNLISTSNFIIQ